MPPSSDHITSAIPLSHLPGLMADLSKYGWAFDCESDPRAITRQIVFSDFNACWAVMMRCADYAQDHDHHPDWQNCYNKLRITLSTHDAGNRISQKDIDFAQFINELVL